MVKAFTNIREKKKHDVVEDNIKEKRGNTKLAID